MRRSAWVLLTAVCMLAGCDLRPEPEIQPLPPLTRASPEARMGLPEIEGEWHFTGWELSVSEPPPGLAGAGDLRIQTQRLDSLAGVYVAGEQRLPLIGEVRRDSIFTLVAQEPGGVARFLAGRARADTIWVELTSLAFAQTWPAGTRAAFVRDSVAQPFVRLPGGVYLAREDTAAADTMAAPLDIQAPPGPADTVGTPPSPAARDTAAGTPPRQTPPAPPAARDTAARRDTTRRPPPRTGSGS